MHKLLLVSSLLVFLAFSCTNSTETNDATTTESQTEETTTTAADTETEATVDMTGPEYTSAYVCPMHCPGSGSAEPGTCPGCGMDYVALADLEDHDHDHDHDHEDHQH